jgi:hypothetical protein
MDLASITPYIDAALSFAAGAWVGPYLGGYARKMSEIHAMHDGIDKLTKQVAAVTTTTEQIKAEISDAAWNRQKRWELKREVLFEAVKRIAEIDEALVSLNAPMQVEHKPDDVWWHETVAERRDKWMRAAAGSDAANALVAVVCEPATLSEFLNVRQAHTVVALAILEQNDAEIFTKRKGDFNILRSAVRAAVQKELGIDA